uniref:Saposin B-type domain-containing protein n=1 Tax=Heterorhabditis bacteriophora TaxID=37862 RepID=A0A1I7XVB9_HETBA
MKEEQEMSCTSDKIKEFLTKMAKECNAKDLTDTCLAEFLSECDALKYLRDQFYYPKCGTLPDVDSSLCDPDADSIYLCGNSLGLMPKPTERIMKEQLDKWAQMGVFGHMSGDLPWAYCDEAAVEGVARLVGANNEEIALCNGLTVNIHVLLVVTVEPSTNFC